MRPRLLALSFATCLSTLSSTVLAAPAIEKERIGPLPTESSLSREQALQLLVEGEQLLRDQTAEALIKMLEAYAALEQSEGPEAPGVKELRSWLVKALETVELHDDAAALRARGSYVDHPLSIMPSTWFPQSNASASMSGDEAVAAVEQGLGLLEQGNVDGLALLLSAYEAIEREQGPESEDAKVLRSFLVGLLETGGFVDEAKLLRARGSVVEPTPEDTEVYAATWVAILESEQAGASPIGASPSGSSGLSDAIKQSSSGGSSSSSSDGSSFDSSPDSSSSNSYEQEEDDYKPRAIEKGSPIPSVLIDLGIGSFQPEYGRKGLIWTAGLELHWTLFRAKWFGMQLGGGGQFGRNRDKRWLADARGELRLNFDFSKVYLRPEFGGGYDQIAGGKLTIAEAYHVAPAAYYHFGGTLGVRFADRFGLYGRAVRLNRGDTPTPNETRVRGGFLFELEKAALDFAFVFVDYDRRGDDPGARMISGNLGIRF